MINDFLEVTISHVNVCFHIGCVLVSLLTHLVNEFLAFVCLQSGNLWEENG